MDVLHVPETGDASGSKGFHRALTLILAGPNSEASCRTLFSKAAFAVPITLYPGYTRWEASKVIATTLPPSVIRGAA